MNPLLQEALDQVLSDIQKHYSVDQAEAEILLGKALKNSYEVIEAVRNATWKLNCARTGKVVPR